MKLFSFSKLLFVPCTFIIGTSFCMLSVSGQSGTDAEQIVQKILQKDTLIRDAKATMLGTNLCQVISEGAIRQLLLETRKELEQAQPRLSETDILQKLKDEEEALRKRFSKEEVFTLKEEVMFKAPNKFRKEREDYTNQVLPDKKQPVYKKVTVSNGRLICSYFPLQRQAAIQRVGRELHSSYFRALTPLISNSKVTLKGEEVVDNYPCYILRLEPAKFLVFETFFVVLPETKYIDLYIDKQKFFWLRVEQYDSENRLILSHVAEEYKPFKVDIWLPLLIRRIVYAYDTQGRQEIRAQTAITVEELKINEGIPDKLFELPDLPKGTTVLDNRTLKPSVYTIK